MRSIVALVKELEFRIENYEEGYGWDRRNGWSQVQGQGLEVLYEFGRFATLVDLLEELDS